MKSRRKDYCHTLLECTSKGEPAEGWIARDGGLSEVSSLNRLERNFKSNGWKTFREVSPDYSKENDKLSIHSSKYRVDLFIYDQKIGYVGIEAKRRCKNKGKVLAEAHEQFNKYKHLTYFNGKKISLWAVYMPEAGDSCIFKEFFCQYGVGWVSEKYIEFGYPNLTNTHWRSLNRDSSPKFIHTVNGRAKIPIDLKEIKGDKK